MKMLKSLAQQCRAQIAFTLRSICALMRSVALNFALIAQIEHLFALRLLYLFLRSFRFVALSCAQLHSVTVALLTKNMTRAQNEHKRSQQSANCALLALILRSVVLIFRSCHVSR